ncbi:hypothetical protein LX87_02007 [Larkinella arboricola]|uniref:Uncharacterized protein n=1 Tax=Larkinella arboricola TaxID=643671 RepID=A0A327X401_LARAB|nr:hypothetical protein [Larkinella arboricola]RAK00305.1 hypothetical protein LX87_02007 [Larkinella arboricola]
MTQAMLIVALLGAMAYLAFQYTSQRLLNCDKLRLLSEEYEKALKGNDRKYAEAVGQTYYSALRGGKLTEEDKKAMTIELDNMFPSTSFQGSV